MCDESNRWVGREKSCMRVTGGWIREKSCVYESNRWLGRVVLGWLLNVPATCECISGTDLLRQFDVLPH